MGEKLGFPLLTAEKSIGTQGLHQPLAGCQMEIFGKFPPSLGAPGKIVVVSKERQAIPIRNFNIGVIEKGPEIIKEAAESHPLKIDKDRLPFPDHDVLRLKIPVNEDRRGLQ
jgi:hypothetical protein